MARKEVDERIHVRYEGNTYNYLVENLELQDNPTDRDLVRAAENALSEELNSTVSLGGFVVEKYEDNGLIDIHPQAKFGR